MRKNIFRSIIAATTMCLTVSVHALTLSPDSPNFDGEDLGLQPPISNGHGAEQGYLESLFNTSGLTLYYKDGPTDGEEGSFDDSYETTFTPAGSEAENATITYVGGTAISCPECYLAIKDGNHSPYFYFFSLAGWNGTEELKLENFWTGPGSISHVAIWGKPDGTTNVPEPGSIVLLALGLAGLATARRRRSV